MIADQEILERLGAWLPPNTEPLRPLMQLATLDADGCPDVRSVLLSEWDAAGFSFHTDARSRKVGQLRSNAGVALVLVLADARRQLVVRGTAVPAEVDGLNRVYAARSPYLRQLAWLNTDEVAQWEQAQREQHWAQFVGERDVADLEPPETWVGFTVRPTRLTFWEADSSAPSRRTEFRLDHDDWSRHYLAG